MNENLTKNGRYKRSLFTYEKWEKGRNRIEEEYNWEREADRIEEIYKELV